MEQEKDLTQQNHELEKDAPSSGLSKEQIQEKLEMYDGFDQILSPLADHMDRFSPRNPNKKRRFLQDEDALDERRLLRDRLKGFVKLMENNANHKDIRKAAQEKLDNNEKLIQQNIGIILKEARDFEQTFKDLENFFRNAAPQKVKNLTLVNTHPDVLIDVESNTIYDEIERLITDQSKSVDQKKAYSTLVIPYLWKSRRPKDIIERYTKLAGEARLQFLTDFADCDSVEDALGEAETKRWQGVTGPEAHHSHLSMFANHILLRDSHDGMDPEGELRGSPSMAVAGKMYSEKVSQPIMGEMNGSLTGSQGLAFHTVTETVADLSDIGFNSTMHAYEKDMVYEACTAFTGGEYSLKRYSIVRTFDYVNRVLRHYLGKVTGQQLDQKRANQVRDTIQDFLDQLAEQKIITKGSVTSFEWNKRVPDRIDIDINIVPLWAVRTFVYALKAEKNKTSANLKETK